MRGLKIAVWCIVGLALYFNIGWAIAMYAQGNLMVGMEETTVAQKILRGPANFELGFGDKSLYLAKGLFLWWPIYLLIIAVAWIGYIAYLFLWLVFGGGVVKLLGVG